MQEGGKLVPTHTAVEHGIREGAKPVGTGVSPWKTRLEVGLVQLRQVCEQPTHTGSMRAGAGQGSAGLWGGTRGCRCMETPQHL